MGKGLTLWRYRRRFSLGGESYSVLVRSRTDGMTSELSRKGQVLARDASPLYGPDAVRNHLLSSTLEDGSSLEVEAGWISDFNIGIAVRRDGALVHESHQGKTIAYPEKYRQMAVESKAKGFGDFVRENWEQGSGAAQDAGYDPGVWQRNKIPLGVDIGTGLLFFAIAKLTDLTTAALVGAGVGIVLLIAQRLTKVDLLGGLAMFGIVMMLISAGLALLFQSDEAVKYRTTALGLLTAALFFGDGLMGGKRLAKRLMRYLPYTDIDAARLGIGMGVMGVFMAATNLVVALFTSTDFWLFYTTFADFVLGMALILLVFKYARGELLRESAPRYRLEEVAGKRES